jgi:uncharacterized protein (TIGR00730 family)
LGAFLDGALGAVPDAVMNDASPSSPIRRLCVYCGSEPGHNPVHAEAAREFGRILAEKGIGLVYGGDSIGLMGEIARSVLRHGGYVTGIIPSFLSEQEHMLTDAQELIVVEDMHQRKQQMFLKSDGFVALPGGLGTLEELVEQLTWAQLGQHSKPIVLANIDGYFEPLLALFAHMQNEGFIRHHLDPRLRVVERVEDIVPAIARELATASSEAERAAEDAGMAVKF